METELLTKQVPGTNLEIVFYLRGSNLWIATLQRDGENLKLLEHGLPDEMFRSSMVELFQSDMKVIQEFIHGIPVNALLTEEAKKLLRAW